MARNRALDALSAGSDPSAGSGFDSNGGDLRPHVLRKMMGQGGSDGYTSPSGAITETAGGGFRVNDLNPSNGIQNFGTSATKAGALKHLRAIEYFKHGGK